MPVPVERQLGLADMVAIVVVAQHALAALGDPFDRPPDLARGPQCQRVFGVVPAFHAKAAADLAGDDSQLGFRDVQDAPRQIGARRVRTLGPDIEGKAAEPIVPLADAAARLHRRGGDSVEDELEPADVIGLGKGRLDRALVAEREPETLVVGTLRPELRRAG